MKLTHQHRCIFLQLAAGPWCKLSRKVLCSKGIVNVNRYTLQGGETAEVLKIKPVCPAVENAVTDGQRLQLWQLECGREGAGCFEVEAGQAGWQLVTRRELKQVQVGEGCQVGQVQGLCDTEKKGRAGEETRNMGGRSAVGGVVIQAVRLVRVVVKCNTPSRQAATLGASISCRPLVPHLELDDAV